MLKFKKSTEIEDPLFPQQRLMALLVPLIIEQILTVTISAADTVMVSTCGEAAVSSVSLVTQITVLLNQLFAAMSTGGAVITAQYIGRKDYDNARRTAKQLIYLCVSIGVIISACILLFHRPILSFIYGKIEEEVMTNCIKYFVICGMGRPFIAMYNASAALFRAVGNSRISMIVSMVINTLNVCGNAILIFGFDLGVAGAAIATMVSYTIGSIILTVLLCRKSGNEEALYIEKIYKPIFNFGMIKRILGIGIPNGLENSMFHLGRLLVASLITTFGTASIAANAVSNTISNFALIPGTAVGIAMVTVIGQCMGAGKVDQAVYYTKKLLSYMYAGMIIMNAAIFIFASPILSCFSLSTEAFEKARFILRVYTFLSATIWPVAFGLPHTFRASGDTKFTMIVSVTSMWIFRIGCSYLLALGFGLELNGVWYAMYIDWIVRSTIFVIHFIRGKWKTIKVI